MIPNLDVPLDRRPYSRKFWALLSNMDAKPTANADIFELSISMAEARELAELVATCGYWDLIGDQEHREPMKFLLALGTDCRFAAKGTQPLRYSITSGTIRISRVQLSYLADFYQASVKAEGRRYSLGKRLLLTLRAKTLFNRLEAVRRR